MSRVAGAVTYDHWCDTCNEYLEATSCDARKWMRSHKARSDKHRKRLQSCPPVSARQRNGGGDDDNELAGCNDEDVTNVATPLFFVEIFFMKQCIILYIKSHRATKIGCIWRSVR